MVPGGEYGKWGSAVQIAEHTRPSLLSDGDQASSAERVLMPPVLAAVFLLIAAVLVAVAFCMSQTGATGWLPAPPAVVIAIEVTGQGAVMPGGVAVPWDVLRSSFQQQRDALRLSSVSAAAATVIVRAAGEMPTGRVQEVLEAGRTAGFQRFALKKAEGGGPPRGYPAEGGQVLGLRSWALDSAPRPKAQDPRPLPPSIRQLPTIKIRLRAGADGSLADIRLNRRPLANLDELRSALRAILLGDDDLPAPAGSGPQIELDCDYNLRYAETLRAIAAVCGDRTDDGRTRLVDRLKFAPRRPPSEKETTP
jgi:biopolymer transport protein ExbD